MQQSQNEITEKYKTWLLQLGYGKSTVKMLPACVKEFLMYTRVTEVKMLNAEQINSFYEYLQGRKHQRKQTVLSEVFISHHMYALGYFLTGWNKLAR